MFLKVVLKYLDLVKWFKSNNLFWYAIAYGGKVINNIEKNKLALEKTLDIAYL